MRWSLKQCLAWLVLSLTLIAIKFTETADTTTHTGSHSNDSPQPGPSTSSGPGPPPTSPPPPGAPPPGPVRFRSQVAPKSVFENVFNYLFGLDYPYHQFTPPREEETVELPESVYTKKKPTFDDIDFSDIDEDKLHKMFQELLLDYHPGHGTEYNAEWGHATLTKDGRIPLEGDAIHLDIFDGYLPKGVSFNDLRVLFLYTIEETYYLYKIKFGDMVVTLRPDLENVTVHLFESYGGLMIIRILFFVHGMFEKHEYIETGKKTRLFKKLYGRSITPAMPKFPKGVEVTEEMIREWMRNRYKDIAKTNPPIVEELINYKIVFTR